MNVEEDRSCPRDDSPVGSVSSFSEICSDDQNVLRSSCNHSQSPEISSDRQHSCSKLSPQKDAGSDHSVNGDGLAGKLSVALADIRAKEDMVEQHARVTEEAVAGWEKAELEVANLKQELESSALKNLVLEDKLEHLDGALKGCVRQLCQAREEQEENIHVAVINKTRHWDSERLKLENQLSEVKSLLEFTQAEASASSMANHDFEEKLIAMQKENSDLRLKLQSMSEQLKVQTLEREFSIQTAETVSRQHLESIKKICKLETECRRLQIMCRKSRECNSDQKSLRNSTYMESLTDSQSDNGERMIALGSDTSLSDSWASALIMDLDQCKSDKKANKKILDSSSLDLNLMDDFLEMEKLAAMPETQHTTISPRNDLGSSSDAVSENSPSKGEHELAVRRIAVLEQTVERMEIERAELEIILADTQEKLEISCNHVEESDIRFQELQQGLLDSMKESENKLLEVQTLLNSAYSSKQDLEIELKNAEDERKKLEIQLVVSHSEVKRLNDMVEISSNQLKESDMKLAELETQLLQSANAWKQNSETERKELKRLIDDAQTEVQLLLDKVHSMDEKLEKERIVAEKLRLKCEELEDELLLKKQEEKLRQAAYSNGELKIKQEQDLAAAAGKLAECQQTITSLGQQLKSLAGSVDDDFLEVEKKLENGIRMKSFSNDPAREIDSISVSSILSSGKERWSPSSYFRISSS